MEKETARFIVGIVCVVVAGLVAWASNWDPILLGIFQLSIGMVLGWYFGGSQERSDRDKMTLGKLPAPIGPFQVICIAIIVIAIGIAAIFMFL